MVSLWAGAELWSILSFNLGYGEGGKISFPFTTPTSRGLWIPSCGTIRPRWRSGSQESPTGHSSAPLRAACRADHSDLPPESTKWSPVGW